MRIEPISLECFFDQCSSMFEDHNEEINNSDESLDIDYNLYKGIDNSGALIILGLFDDDKIVGYSMSCLSPHPHFKSKIVCFNDVIYLKKAYRKGFNGVKLIKRTNEEARLRGANIVSWGAKKDSSLSKLLEILKYNTHEVIYTMEV